MKQALGKSEIDTIIEKQLCKYFKTGGLYKIKSYSFRNPWSAPVIITSFSIQYDYSLYITLCEFGNSVTVRSPQKPPVLFNFKAEYLLGITMKTYSGQFVLRDPITSMKTMYGFINKNIRAFKNDIADYEIC